MNQISFDKRKLINKIMANDLILSNEPFDYLFFKLEPNEYEQATHAILKVEVKDGYGMVEINGYLERGDYRLSPGFHDIKIDMEGLEVGENVIAFKGNINVLNIDFGSRSSIQATNSNRQVANTNLEAATEFLCNSVITQPKSSPFKGSCYAIYDYTNQCFRMPCWLWSDAPIIEAMIRLIESGKFITKHDQIHKTALGIGDVFLNTQITKNTRDCYGALLSRYRYYGKTSRSFDRLLGPNDTSFSVKWGLLPLYKYTGEERYLDASRIALEWVERTAKSLDYIPSHYYDQRESWEGHAFVDTGFCVEGFAEYDRIVSSAAPKYKNLITLIMDRLIKQFKMHGGYFGPIYRPGEGIIGNRIFTRGQAWVLEGLISAYLAIGHEEYLNEAIDLATLLMQEQNQDGSWSYFLGYGKPDERTKKDTGICEKATAVISYLLASLYSISRERKLFNAAEKALKWCDDNMCLDDGPGYGGIFSKSLGSCITGSPFIEVATGYANAFYILAKLKMEELNQ